MHNNTAQHRWVAGCINVMKTGETDMRSCPQQFDSTPVIVILLDFFTPYDLCFSNFNIYIHFI